jgi:hypothetical protein
VERCPSCGVEHDVSADSICGACDTPLRAWCRAHSREAGWLDGPACDRCAKEAAPAPRSRAATALPCPDVSGAIASPAFVSAPAPAAGRAELAKAPADAMARMTSMSMVEHHIAMLLMMLLATGGSTLLGVITGFVYVFFGFGSLPDTPLWFALIGAVVGLITGGWACRDHVKQLRTAPPDP